MKYCENCGKELREGQDFCLSCGKKIRKAINNSTPTPFHFEWWHILLIVLGSILALIWVIFLFASDYEDESSWEYPYEYEYPYDNYDRYQNDNFYTA